MLQKKIELKPQYQRTPVWKIDRRKLLIDSIFRGYDLPKLYFHELENNLLFEYAVCDGQQRLNSIFDFKKDIFPTNNQTFFGDIDISKKVYSMLCDEIKEHFLDYKLTVAIISQATQKEIRELFARLQKGVGLNQAELRRAMSSHIGSLVESVVDVHPFFKECGITDVRYKSQDFIDHSIAYAVNRFSNDFKGANLKDIYGSVSPEEAIKRIQEVTSVLDDMVKINSYSVGIFKYKWVFLDTFIFLYDLFKANKKINHRLFALDLIKFEKLRKTTNKREFGKLLSSADEVERNMYYYIRTFEQDGALKKNVEERNRVFNSIFGKLIK